MIHSRLAQTGDHQTKILQVPSSITTGGNIFLPIVIAKEISQGGTKFCVFLKTPDGNYFGPEQATSRGLQIN